MEEAKKVVALFLNSKRYGFQGCPWIVIFGIPKCPYCRNAIALLPPGSGNFVDLNQEGSSELRQALITITSRKTVPQIVVINLFPVSESLNECEWVGGSDKFPAYLEQHGL